MQFTNLRVGPLGAADSDVVALNHPRFTAGFGASEANGAHVGLAAGVRAAGPVDLDLLRQAQLLIKLSGCCQGLVFGVG